jgi:hypothetical protein
MIVWGTSSVDSHPEVSWTRRPPGRWWHPEGDKVGEALSAPLQLLPYRQHGLSNLSVGRQIRSPNKSEPKFDPSGLQIGTIPNLLKASNQNETIADANLRAPAGGRKPRCHVVRPCWFSKATPPALPKQDVTGSSPRSEDSGAS